MRNIYSRLTPINDLDPTCERTDATLCIYHIIPETVTNKLGIVPTSIQEKGIPKTLPSGKKRVGTVNSWLLSSEASHIESKDIRTHLDWLLSKIEPLLSHIKELQEYPDVKMSVQCTWWSAVGGGGPTLWPEQMKALSKLNLECGFHFAYYGVDST